MHAKRTNLQRIAFAAIFTFFAVASWFPRTFATQPDVQQVVPPGGQRGSEVDLAIDGRRLDDAQELLWYDDGISVKSLEFADKKSKSNWRSLRIARWVNTPSGCAPRPD